MSEEETASSKALVRADTTGETKAIHRVLRRMSNGASMRSACRAEGISRYLALRRIERSPPLQQRYAFSIAARAHQLADELLAIADGVETADAFGKELAAALAGVAPQHAAAVAKGMAAQRVQRDRLRAEMRRWIASRLLPAVYGSQQRSLAPAAIDIRVAFDAPEKERALPHSHTTEVNGQHADYEIL